MSASLVGSEMCIRDRPSARRVARLPLVPVVDTAALGSCGGRLTQGRAPSQSAAPPASDRFARPACFASLRLPPAADR
eukprot:11978487-Alexandrium_andersonii.AAC.1